MTTAGKYLRILRLKRCMGMSKLARATGISPSFLSNIETGESPPPAARVAALVIAMDLTDAELIELGARLKADEKKRFFADRRMKITRRLKAEIMAESESERTDIE